MSGYDIALSGMKAANAAFDVIGNNITNSATEGYHKQRLVLTPSVIGSELRVDSGQGVVVDEVVRQIDSLLEQEIYRQQSFLKQADRESMALRTLETTLGELSSGGGGLNAAMDAVFNALDDLSAHPWDNVYQNQVISETDALANQFRSLGTTLMTMEENLRLEAERSIDTVNSLATQVADMNVEIARVSAGGEKANLVDRRDEAISRMSELVGVTILPRDYGMADVTVNDIAMVTGGRATELTVSMTSGGELGVSVAGSSVLYTDLQGGTIGALQALRNTTVADVHTNIDLLAATIIQDINDYHVQGVGSSGSFSSLTGTGNASDTLSELTGVSAGYTYIRVTNSATDAVTRTRVPVLQDASSDTLTEVAAYITASVANVTASVGASNQLYLSAASGYTFDFLPQVLPEPNAADITFTGSSDPAVSFGGVYTGTANDTYTFTVTGTGNVGVDSPLTLTVTDASAATVAVLNIGSGYAAGDLLDIGESGIHVALGIGDLVAGNSFSVDILADSDTSGLLATTGLNTFFEGTSAYTMAVRADILNDMGRVASSLVAGEADNGNAVRLASLREKQIAALGNLSSGQYYRRLVTNVGQDLSTKEMQRGSFEDILHNLDKQQSSISGVDVNDEAAQLLVFEQMFQAMARYLVAVQNSIDNLMDLL